MIPSGPPSTLLPPSAAALRWQVDEFASYFDRMRLRGWCFSAPAIIAKVEVLFPAAAEPWALRTYGLPSPDVAAAVHPEAHHVRFDEWVALPEAQRGRDFTLRIHFADGTSAETPSVSEAARRGDPAHECWYHFLDRLALLDAGAILEIGSRARSAVSVRPLLPPQLPYVGLDIVAGPNVDVVGDAHHLSGLFPPRRFKAALARSVFEHLAMPWKVVLELNRVLEVGGIVFIATHQTWVLHEEPWDFWRFSRHTWPCLFNRETGFEIIEVAQGEPARIHPMWDSPIVRDLPSHPAFLSSAVMARKMSETGLTWNVPVAAVVKGDYLPGDLDRPPHRF